MMLEKSKGYPWRPSLTKKARCGMCKHKRGSFGLCSKGHKMKYPTLANVHNCKDYDYEEIPFKKTPKGKILVKQHGLIDAFSECKDCAHNLQHRCSGVRWFPWKTNPCEFFRHKNLVCRHAIPYFQYDNEFRNNFCKCPPRYRQKEGFSNNNSWSNNCPFAHKKGAETISCYKPKRTDDCIRDLEIRLKDSFRKKLGIKE